MERQDRREISRPQMTEANLTDTSRFDEQRRQIEELLSTADKVFNSLNGLTAQQYLEQNQQTGGQ